MTHKFFLSIEIEVHGLSWFDEAMRDLRKAVDAYITRVFSHEVEFVDYARGEVMWVFLTTGRLPHPGTLQPGWHSGWYDPHYRIAFAQYGELSWYHRWFGVHFKHMRQSLGDRLGMNLSHELEHVMANSLGLPDRTHEFLEQRVYIDVNGDVTSKGNRVATVQRYEV